MAEKFPYEDIVDLPPHISKKHPQPTMLERAARFAPFAAITGYEEMVLEEARVTDERIELDESRVLAVIEKQIKQRKESIKAYEGANRQDLASKEQAEFEIISQFLPAAMTEEELDSVIEQTILAQQATSIKDMGKVMNSLRPIIAGRADPAQVSAKIKAKLA
mgnify:CR=1 FL=1